MAKPIDQRDLAYAAGVLAAVWSGLMDAGLDDETDLERLEAVGGALLDAARAAGLPWPTPHGADDPYGDGWADSRAAR